MNLTMLIINILILLINVIVTTLGLKMYTEYFKDRSATKRWGEEKENQNANKAT